MAVQLITKNELFDKENVEVNVLIGDDDSSTISAVRREASHPIEKWSDINHCVKTIEAIVPHAFGNHSHCADWCKGSSCELYVHHNLPNGKPLTDDKLKERLTSIFHRFASNAKKIAPCASTQTNESVNNIVASKNPKSKHYSASESFSFRTAAAVCQKNVGTHYGAKVLQRLCLNPGTETETYRLKKDKKRALKAATIKEIKYKKRKYELKKTRSSRNSAYTRKEGDSYKSGGFLVDNDEILENAFEISDKIANINSCKIVVYDLETSGLSMSDEILQISASTDKSTFNTYIIPSKTISKSASSITGLHLENGDVYHNEDKIAAIPAQTAAGQFLDFLEKFDCPVILLAHNGTTYLPNVDTSKLHNAVNDVDALKKLFIAIGITDDIIRASSKTCTEINDTKRKKLTIQSNKITLTRYTAVVSQRMINKLAAAGINEDKMQQVYEIGGRDGVLNLLTENVDGRPRVTTNKKVVQKILSLFPEV
ncbi:uncharacterized protein [Prorops nasuta]|uniref:uncharacterized protein n=1 Tax=Prorops nasuta TaxID=863751 RepID=UPI0034CEC962